MVPIHTYSYHAACSLLKQSVKWIYIFMSCESGTRKHTYVSKSVALWKNILLEFISVFWCPGCPLCFMHWGFVPWSAVFGILELAIHDLSQVYVVTQEKSWHCCVLFPVNEQSHLELLPGSCCADTALCCVDKPWRRISCKSLIIVWGWSLAFYSETCTILARDIYILAIVSNQILILFHKMSAYVLSK